MNRNVLQHFRKEEAPYLDYCNGLCQQARNQYRPILTHFLNPRQSYMLRVITNSYNDLHLKLFGGYAGAEMLRAIIFPKYFTPSNKDFEIILAKVNYPIKFSHLKHSQILGTLMSSGIKRNVIGDIITDGVHWQFFAERPMLTFLKFQIRRINRNRVSLSFLPLSQAIFPKDDWQNEFKVVASLRVDTIISAGFNISRAQSKSLVTHNHVKINWAVINRPNDLVKVHDILSIRQYGRLKIENIKGRSKKNKLKITLSVINK